VTTDDYPSKPIRYIVPFGSGPTGVQAKWIAERLGAALGQRVVVENHPGEGGAAGTRMVAQAEPDGYTLLAANPGPLTVAPAVRGGTGYDPEKDFSRWRASLPRTRAWPRRA
jgi:tripartite-type tricarboxylate transporter receptor subunit TctC